MTTVTVPGARRPDLRPAVRLRLVPSPAEQAARAARIAQAADSLLDVAAVIREQPSPDGAMESLAVIAEVVADQITAYAAAAS